MVQFLPGYTGKTYYKLPKAEIGAQPMNEAPEDTVKRVTGQPCETYTEQPPQHQEETGTYVGQEHFWHTETPFQA